MTITFLVRSSQSLKMCNFMIQIIIRIFILWKYSEL